MSEPDPRDEHRDYHDELEKTDYSNRYKFGNEPNQNHHANQPWLHMVNNRTGNSRDNNNSLAENGNLSKAWNSSAPNTAPKPASKGFYAGASGGAGTSAAGRRFSKNSKIPLSAAELKARVKKRIIAGVIASVLGVGGIGIGVSMPALFAGKIMDVVTKKFNAPASKSIGSRTKSLLKCKLTASCAKAVNEKTGATTDNGAGMGQISDDMITSFEKNGSQITGPDITNGSDGMISLNDGKIKIGTGANGSESLSSLSAHAASELNKTSPAMNGEYGASSGKPTANTLKTTGANKNIPLSENVGNDKDGKARTISEQLDDQKKATTDTDPNGPRAPPEDLTAQNAKTVSPSETPDFVSSKKSNSNDDADATNKSKVGFDESSGGSKKIQSAKDIDNDAKAKIKDTADDATKGGGSAVAKKALNIACGLATAGDGLLKTYRLGVKLNKILQLSRFAYMFLTVMNSIQAADGSGREGHNGPTSAQFTQLMSSLTTVLKSKDGKVVTKSGTDSFGYQSVAGYLTPKKSGSTFDLANADSGKIGAPSAFTSKVVVNSDAGDRSLMGQLLGEMPDLGTGVVNTLVKNGCAGLPIVLGLMDISALEGKTATLSELGVPGAGLVAAGLLTADLVGNVAGWIAEHTDGTISSVFSWSAITLGTVSACGEGLMSFGAGAGGCVMQFIALAAMIAMPKIVDGLIDYFTKDFLKNPMPVGENAMDALISGAGASQGINAANNGVPVMASTSTTAGLTKYLAVNRELAAYNREQDAIKREGASPFDIYNTATFAGSIMGNFAAAIYANGNEPLQMAGSLLGMFGTSFASIISGTSAYADAANTAYASSCTDSDITEAKLAADPFCNPIYGMAQEDEMELEDVMEAITKWQDAEGKSAIDSTVGDDKYDDTYGLNRDAVIAGAQGVTKLKIGDFINECVTRNDNESKFSPMGSSDEKQGDGKNCSFGNDSKFSDNTSDDKDRNLKILYNYIQYYLANSNLNQGLHLGCEADGSCADKGSGSSQVASGAYISPLQSCSGTQRGSSYDNHSGLDYSCNDSPVDVNIITNGKILSVRSCLASTYPGASGCFVEESDDGKFILYQHCSDSSIAVKVGDKVNAGQKACRVEAPAGGLYHVHLGIRKTNGDFNNFPMTNSGDFLNPACLIKNPTIDLQGSSTSIASLVPCQ